jgi:hypothetical protein
MHCKLLNSTQEHGNRLSHGSVILLKHDTYMSEVETPLDYQYTFKTLKDWRVKQFLFGGRFQ